MAHFQRLIFVAFVLFSSWVPSAFALIPTGLTSIRYINGSVSTAQGNPEAMCATYGPLRNAYDGSQYVTTVIGVSADKLVCQASRTGPYGTIRVDANGWYPTYSCPSNSSPSSDKCSCNVGFEENSTHTACIAVCPSGRDPATGECVDPAAEFCEALKGMGTYLIAPGTASPGGSVCAEIGCMATWSDYVLRVTDKTTGAKTSQGSATLTATPCTPVPATSAAESDCVGEKGTVNGVDTCVNYDTNENVVESIKKDSTTTASTTQPTASAPAVASSGATSSTSTTSCTNGSCNTTTVTESTNPDGSTGTQTTEKTEPIADFCKDNPESPVCKESDGSFSGSCADSAPECEGDAVMCAVATATFQTNCALKMPEDTDEQSAYDAGKSATGDQTKELPDSPDPIDVGPGAFDQSDMIGGGSSGMTDLAITVHGQSITLPFSDINVWLGRLGSLLQAVTFLICAYIVTGNKQGGSS